MGNPGTGATSGWARLDQAGAGRNVKGTGMFYILMEMWVMPVYGFVKR